MQRVGLRVAQVRRDAGELVELSRRIAPEHVLLALLACAHPDPAAELLAHLRVDHASVRARLDQTTA